MTDLSYSNCPISSSSSSYSSGQSNSSPTTPTSNPPSPPSQHQQAVKPLQNTKAFNRSQAIQELLQTESIYASDLIVIRDIYLYRSSGPPPSPPPLAPSDRLAIFSNIPQIAQLAESLAAELVIASDKHQIGQCFIRSLPMIEKLYTTYCSKYELANKKLEQFYRKIQSKQKKHQFSCSSTSPSSHSHHQQTSHHAADKQNEHPGTKYLRECKSLSQGRTSAWDLGSLLIKPVQRCLKYSLLLDQIIKFTEFDHPDRHDLIMARDGMVHVADKINQAKRRNELAGEMISRSGPIGVIYPAVLLGQQGGSGSHRSSTPVELSRLIKQVKRSTKALNRLPGDIRTSEYSIKNWFLSADRLADAFKSVFVMKNSSSQQCPQASNIDVADLLRYQHLVLLGALNGPLKYLHDRIESEILPKINELKELYTKPMVLISRYEKRRRVMLSGPSTSSASQGSRTSGEVSSRSSQSSGSQQSDISAPGALSPESKASELEEVEGFLLDQLPKLHSLATHTLNLILADLAHSFKLCHSDLIILIKKAVFKA